MIRTFALSLLSVLAIASTANAGIPVRSIHDLPMRWEGVAGDLVVRVPSTFTIEKILNVVRVPNPRPSADFHLIYDVQATLSFGDRSVAVKKIELRNFHFTPTLVEMLVHLEDELVPTMILSVIYNETTNSFSLKDPTSRRMSLSGRAP